MPQKTGKSDVPAEVKKIGPVLIFERLWQETGIKKAIQQLLVGRKYEFDVERAVFMTTLHRLLVSGSDRNCDRWHCGYLIYGVDDLKLHHLYRAIVFLGEATNDQQ